MGDKSLWTAPGTRLALSPMAIARHPTAGLRGSMEGHRVVGYRESAGLSRSVVQVVSINLKTAHVAVDAQANAAWWRSAATAGLRGWNAEAEHCGP